MLSYDGSEFYTKEWPEIVGKTLDEISVMFPAAIPSGVVQNKNKVLLNPPSEYVMKEGDELLCIAEDNDRCDIYHPLSLSYILS